jgi:hypothetical protein
MSTNNDNDFVFKVPSEALKMEVQGSCKACSKLGQRSAFQSHLPGVTNEVYLLRFRCDECGYGEAEIKRDGYSSLGRTYQLTVESLNDLRRPLLHSSSAGTLFAVIVLLFFLRFFSVLKTHLPRQQSPFHRSSWSSKADSHRQCFILSRHYSKVCCVRNGNKSAVYADTV